jgi:fatty acid-binding protein DegV
MRKIADASRNRIEQIGLLHARAIFLDAGADIPKNIQTEVKKVLVPLEISLDDEDTVSDQPTQES